MSLLEIKKFKSPELRKKCAELGKIDEAVKKLVFDMVETMKKSQGMGLAAPQVGVSKRIIVVHGILDGREGDYLALINPKIIKKSKEKGFFEEGCLSFPGIFLKIKRPKSIEVETWNLRGDTVKIKAAGLLARVLQHEIDHLDGILFFDRLGFYQKLRKKLGWKTKKRN